MILRWTSVLLNDDTVLGIFIVNALSNSGEIYIFHNERLEIG